MVHAYVHSTGPAHTHTHTHTHAHTHIHTHGACLCARRKPCADARCMPVSMTQGDGVWEGLRLHRGIVLFARDHLHKLFEGAAAIGMDLDLSAQGILDLVYQAVQANGMSNASGTSCASYPTGSCTAAAPAISFKGTLADINLMHFGILQRPLLVAHEVVGSWCQPCGLAAALAATPSLIPAAKLAITPAATQALKIAAKLDTTLAAPQALIQPATVALTRAAPM